MSQMLFDRQRHIRTVLRLHVTTRALPPFNPIIFNMSKIAMERGELLWLKPCANWLIPYLCEKDIRGLIKMPFSRHWIMHIEAMRRIKNRLCKLARKGVDPIRSIPDEAETIDG